MTVTNTGLQASSPGEIRRTYGEYFVSLLKPNDPKEGHKRMHDMIKDMIHRIWMKSTEEDESEQTV